MVSIAVIFMSLLLFQAKRLFRGIITPYVRARQNSGRAYGRQTTAEGTIPGDAR